MPTCTDGLPTFGIQDMGEDMEFNERLAAFQAHVLAKRALVKGEEPTKTALVLPFMRMLGYDVFDPAEVSPGFALDAQSRADYAVRDGETVRILITLTSTPADLSTERAVRLANCFPRAEAHVAVLTDGSLYHVHGAMPDRSLDPEPLLALDVTSVRDHGNTGLEHISADAFDVPTLISGAAERRRRDAVAHALHDELADPSEGFIGILAARMAALGAHAGDDMGRILGDVVAELTSGPRLHADASPAAVAPAVSDEPAMTDDEELAYHIVRAICARHLDPSRVVARPAKSYVAVLLDDNNRRPVARIAFKAISTKYLVTFVEGDETRNPVTRPDGIYKLEGAIESRLRELDPDAFGQAEG